MKSISATIAEWVSEATFEIIPGDVVLATKNRILDVLGLIMAARDTPFGQSLLHVAALPDTQGPCDIIGSSVTTNVLQAAFTHGALSGALEYDDTHNESIVHMSSPSVGAALAMSQRERVTGHQFILAIAVGSEIACRIGRIAPGEFHKRGFQPTALFSTFSTAYLTGLLLRLDAEQMRFAAGIAGSFASGILECYSDGTQSKYLHQGMAARNGIESAMLAQAGVTGPETVLEGRFGIFESHLQNLSGQYDLERATYELGSTWYSRNSSFKPFPCAHIIHPYIDALLKIWRKQRFDLQSIREIRCTVAPFNVPIVCEPLQEKRRPSTDTQGRLSLQYTLAESLVNGKLDVKAYRPEHLVNPLILRIADRVTYEVDPSFPGPERFTARISVTLENGCVFTGIEDNNRGSPLNPMSSDQICDKFRENSSAMLNADQQDAVIAAVASIDTSDDASEIVKLCAFGR